MRETELLRPSFKREKKRRGEGLLKSVRQLIELPWVVTAPRMCLEMGWRGGLEPDPQGLDRSCFDGGHRCYFGAQEHVPLRVALLLAVVGGILLTALAGSARIMQLRATARKHRRADHRAVKAGAKDSSKARW
ncbi:hypothetical protein GCM10023086_58490 [Streptomyces venetus]|uniref:Uncharacterized protein n=1 Tax=Streptomyces venetus TaxID=1701086 RepID=A0ABP8GSX6_9ACTN